MEGDMTEVERRGGSMSRRSSRGVYPIPDPSFPPPLPQVAYIQPERRKRASILIPLFTLVIVVLFLITMFVNNCPSTIIPGRHCVARFLGRFSFQPMSENPLLGPSSSTLVKMGALESDMVTHHQGWRLLTCMWLHAGVFHLLVNMLSLLVIGIRLEQEFGLLRIGVIYLLSGFGGSLLSSLFLENRISVGASGALFGLLGAMLSELIINWTIYTNKCASFIMLMLIVTVNLAVGILPHVDNFAHIGGFISGFLLGFIFLVRPQFGWVDQKKVPPGFVADRPVRSKHKMYQYIFWIIAFLLLIAGFTTALVMVLHGENANEHCSWCHYLSCVPTSRWSCDEDGIKCESTIQNSTLILTCQSMNKTQSFEGLASDSSSKIRQLCTQLCS